MYRTRGQSTALQKGIWTQIKWRKKKKSKMVFRLLWSSCFWSAQNLFALHKAAYTVLRLDMKNIWVIKLYSGCHMPGIASITSALRKETALTNQALYALGRRQTALYSVGRSHYGSSPQMTIHWSHRGKALGKRRGRGDRKCTVYKDVNSPSRF